MSTFKTKYFGDLAYDPESVLEFAEGLPGFETERQFVLIEQPASKPLGFLQSLRTPELCFITLPLLGIEPDYKLQLTPEERSMLGLEGDQAPVIGRDVAGLAIVSVTEGEDPTANLLAPVIISLGTRRAVQSIQSESGYSHQHKLSTAQEAPCS